jgi:hypothetical protein
MAKHKKPIESVDGSYTPFLHCVMDSVAFMQASHVARSLMLELMRQHNGSNNGRLHLTKGWLERRGWASSDQVDKAKKELIARNLIVQTKQGGLNVGPSWFALTWLPISNHVGLELQAKNYHKGAWHFLDRLQVPGSRGRGTAVTVKGRNSAKRTVKRNDCSGKRNSSDPVGGMATPPPDPSAGTNTALSGASSGPSGGNNECLPLPIRKTRAPVVGRKGASGIRKLGPVDDASFKSDQQRRSDGCQC